MSYSNNLKLFGRLVLHADVRMRSQSRRKIDAACRMLLGGIEVDFKGGAVAAWRGRVFSRFPHFPTGLQERTTSGENENGSEGFYPSCGIG
jgi:hypothetical protein